MENLETAIAAIDETKKAIDMLGSFAAQAQNIDWLKVGAELKDLDDSEKKELLILAAKKVLAGLLVIISE
jgi:uncharacterized protein YpuA (DUF1002 family)